MLVGPVPAVAVGADPELLPGVGVFVTTCVCVRGVGVSVGVLVALALKRLRCDAKNAIARMIAMSSKRPTGKSQRGIPLGFSSAVRTVLIYDSVCRMRAVRYIKSVKWREPVLAGLGVFGVLFLVGCGSSGPPPLVLSCTSHPLSPGLVRVAVKVTNSTAVQRDALLYGSALTYVRHEYPVLKTRQVIVARNGQTTPFVGLVVQHVGANKTATVLLRFQIPPHRETFSVATGTSVHDTGAGSSTCHIG